MIQRRPMTADEIAMGEALGFIRVLPATFDKRFVGEMAACARDDEPAITEKEAVTLRRMVHKYRRQIPAAVLALAGERPPNPWDAAMVTPPPGVTSDAPPPDSPARVHQSAPTAQLSLL